MELFTITCTTCKSRLKVRDQAAIGQILACPKCGGMVMVKPPPAWDEAAEQKSDLPTATELVATMAPLNQTLDSSAFDVVEELLSDSPPKVQPPPHFSPPPAAPAVPKPRFVGGPPAHRSPPPPPGTPAKPSATPAKPSTTPTKATVASAIAAPVPASPKAAAEASQIVAGANGQAPPSSLPDPAPVAPPQRAETDVEQHRRQPLPAAGRRYWLLMASSIALGILLAFAAVIAAIYFVPRTDVPARTTHAASKTGTPRSNEASNPKSSVASTLPDSALPVESPSTAEQPPATSLPTATGSNSSAPTAATADPLGLAKEPPTTSTSPPTASDPLAKFDRLIGGASDDPLAKNAAPLQPASIPPTEATPPRPLAPRPPPREVDVAKRLADPLPAIQTPGTPLADFLQLMSDLSTIPITLELPFAPATTESPVVLRLTSTTVEKALAEALRSLPVRLEYVVLDDQLIIRRAEPNPVAPFAQEVKDLTGGEEQQLSELAELLKSVVEPAAWGEGEATGSIAIDAAKGTIVITHRRAVQLQVLIALDKLRTARTPPLKPVLKFDPVLFKPDTRSVQAKPRLERPVSLNYSQPTRLLTILDRLGEAAGVRIVVDWRDVATAGWNPAADASLVVTNQPLAAALDALLHPLDLTWRIIDGQTLQVVTPARLAEQGELELYKVDDLVGGGTSGEALLAKLRGSLGDGLFREAGGNGEIRYEPDSKCLLAWLPQPRQRELEALLTKWRSEAPK